MSLNPYEEATISAEFQQPSKPAVPTNKIQWGKIALCYVVSFLTVMFLSFVLGMVIGVLSIATSRSLQDIMESPLYYIGLGAITIIPLVLCIVWLVRKVHTRKFLHASIFAAINLAIDIAFGALFPTDQYGLMWILTFSQVIVILVTAKIAIGVSHDSDAGKKPGVES